MKARPPRPSAASSADIGSSTPARRRSKTGNRIVLTRAGLLNSPGGGAAHRASMLRGAVSFGDRLRQLPGRSQVQPPVERQQLAAVQPVELAHRIGRVVIAEPPEPVRTLAQRQLPPGGGALRRV